MTDKICKDFVNTIPLISRLGNKVGQHSIRHAYLNRRVQRCPS
jgi:hypothetical protein